MADSHAKSDCHGSSLLPASYLALIQPGVEIPGLAGNLQRAERMELAGRLHVALVLCMDKETQVLSTAEHTWCPETTGRRSKSGMWWFLPTPVNTVAQKQPSLTWHWPLSSLPPIWICFNRVRHTPGPPHQPADEEWNQENYQRIPLLWESPEGATCLYSACTHQYGHNDC